MNFTLETSKYTLACAAYEVKNPRAAIVFIHGTGEYAQRHEHVFNKLADAGYSVYAFDLPGHGNSSGKRGHAGSTDELMEAVDALIAYARPRIIDVPVFIMGHSMGGNIALAHRYYRRSARIKGYIASSPWLRTSNDFLNNHYKLVRLLAEAAPRATTSTDGTVKELCVKRAFGFTENDSRYHGKMSFRTAADRERDARLLLENASSGRPVFLFVGDSDPTCLPQAAREFAEKAGKICDFRVWEGYRHELMNEEDIWEQVVDEVVAWVEKMLI